jgi:anti-sigma regulatory factor (Ser/Thr protein kinase)
MLTIASATLPPDPMSVPAARDLVAGVTEHLPRRAREAAELVASELATNCVEHAGTDFEIFAATDDGAVEVVVADGATWTPARPGAVDGEPGSSGQGLLLVGLLAAAWAAELEGTGKRVWARLLVDDVPTS